MQTTRVMYPDGANCHYVGRNGEGNCDGLELTRYDNALKIVHLDAIGSRGRAVKATITFPLSEIDNVIAALKLLKGEEQTLAPPQGYDEMPAGCLNYTILATLEVPVGIEVRKLRNDIQEQVYDLGGCAGNFKIEKIDGDKATVRFTRSLSDDQGYAREVYPEDLKLGLVHQFKLEVEDCTTFGYPLEVVELKYLDPAVPDEVTQGTGD